MGKTMMDLIFPDGHYSIQNVSSIDAMGELLSWIEKISSGNCSVLYYGKEFLHCLNRDPEYEFDLPLKMAIMMYQESHTGELKC